jgi:hypothetical protein
VIAEVGHGPNIVDSTFHIYTIALIFNTYTYNSELVIVMMAIVVVVALVIVIVVCW